MLWLLVVQKLSAMSASLARVVSSAEDEEAELDQFPDEGVRKPSLHIVASIFQPAKYRILTSDSEERWKNTRR